MKITFLIGNGFDLNLGLKTSYSDFLKQYRIDKESDSETIKWFKKDVLTDSDLWSSAEKAFGKCTSHFKNENKNAEMFCECHEDFCINLAEYLQEQEQRVSQNSIESVIETSFKNAITNYYGGFKEVPQNEIKSFIQSISGGYTYNFISFNYTETLDKCVVALKNKGGILGRRNISGGAYQNVVGKLLHVHGYTYRDMILGVNDESQIEDMSIFDGYGEEYVGQLIKIKSNQMNDEGIDEKVHTLLKESNIIYVYGMSIGETDALWWKRICELLKQKKNLLLIIHKYDAPEEKLINRSFVTYTKEKKAEFLSSSTLSDEEKKVISSRIYIDRSNIFKGLEKLVEKKNDNAESN